MTFQRIKLHLLRVYWKMKGVILSNNAFIYRNNEILNPKNLSLGENSILYKELTIYIGKQGSLTIGKNSHIAPYAYLLIDNNAVNIGDNVAIGPFCAFFCHSNSVMGESKLFAENYIDLPIIIGNNVFIGSHTVILPGSIIHDNVVIASNSVVKGVLEENSIYGGSPAKKIKSL
ncbi:MAG: acyltransferase [Bacteroidales bacterium]